MSNDLNTTSTVPSVQTTPEAVPTGVRERLAQILDTAERLYVAAQWLQIDTDELLSDLQDIAKDPATPRKEIDVALDAASWLHHAAENMEGEFDTLIICLGDAIETDVA
jgi:hypothetical protein